MDFACTFDFLPLITEILANAAVGSPEAIAAQVFSCFVLVLFKLSSTGLCQVSELNKKFAQCQEHIKKVPDSLPSLGQLHAQHAQLQETLAEKTLLLERCGTLAAPLAAAAAAAAASSPAQV